MPNPLKNVLQGDPTKQPVYEIIKREDIREAFRDALRIEMGTLLIEQENLVKLYAATQPGCLWVWDFTSRWDFDKWW